ncbi:hypothetical protein BDQ17DRAFT_1547817 [Cyathus striatus]|nr:hypothetical protein BDQ17DRAFT_1547817 [Cyathus striatus]
MSVNARRDVRDVGSSKSSRTRTPAGKALSPLDYKKGFPDPNKPREVIDDLEVRLDRLDFIKPFVVWTLHDLLDMDRCDINLKYCEEDFERSGRKLEKVKRAIEKIEMMRAEVKEKENAEAEEKAKAKNEMLLKDLEEVEAVVKDELNLIAKKVKLMEDSIFGMSHPRMIEALFDHYPGRGVGYDSFTLSRGMHRLKSLLDEINEPEGKWKARAKGK